MNPWHILGNLAAWSMIVVLVLLIGMTVVSVIVGIYRTLRTKRMMQNSRDRRTKVFGGKRQD